MRQGEVIASRFEIERLVGWGGMGHVYRARDLTSGEAVAVKVLQEGYTGGDARFAQEAEMLAELHHPGIVRYVAHGMADSGRRYLAMEWLDGEELADRLHRERLSISETVALMTAAAQGVHRPVRRRDLHRFGLVPRGRDLRSADGDLLESRQGRWRAVQRRRLLHAKRRLHGRRLRRHAVQLPVARSSRFVSFNDDLYVGFRSLTGIAVARNHQAGAGAFNITDVAMSVTFFDLVFDVRLGTLAVTADTPTFHVRTSSDATQPEVITAILTALKLPT